MQVFDFNRGNKIGIEINIVYVENDKSSIEKS